MPGLKRKKINNNLHFHVNRKEYGKTFGKIGM